MDFLLGMNAKLYAGAKLTSIQGTETPVSWTPGVVDNVKDVTLSLEAGEADVTTRGNSGWRATAPTLKEATLEFEMQWLPGDAAFTLIRNAFLDSDVVALAPLTDAVDQSDAEGLVGNWAITNFSRNEALEEAITVSVTAKLSAFAQWLKVT